MSIEAAPAPERLPPSDSSSARGEHAASPERALRKLFLTIFLRGHSARGLNLQRTPKSIGTKLIGALLLYSVIGLFALGLRGASIFIFAVFLHSMTFLFLGMFVASAAGEMLFNREEADILMHRPIEPRTLLWAKISMLVQVVLWMAGALNAGGTIAGAFEPKGSWLFLLVHPLSIALEALFAVSCVVLVYQLCLRWFGRERLDALMTTTQVILSILVVISAELVPPMVTRPDQTSLRGVVTPWLALLPPAWFAGLDDAVVGSHSAISWGFAAAALLATAIVSYLAINRLAQTYEVGLQTLNESATRVKPRRAGRRRLADIVEWRPLRWLLPDAVQRSSFLLLIAYLLRDRDVKLRIFPAIGPMIVIPVVMLFGQPKASATATFDVHAFMIALVGTYLGIVPLFGLTMLQYSQHWRAADLFHAAPLAGPAPICHGARWAVLIVLTLPLFVVFTATVCFLTGSPAALALMAPGIITLPVFSIIPTIGGGAVPLSRPVEDAKSIGRGLTFVPVMFASMIIAGLAAWAWATGWFAWFLLGEAALAAAIYYPLKAALAAARWESLE